MSKGNAVNVYVTTDTTPNPPESWEILLISTKGAKPFKFYRDAKSVKKDFPSTFEDITDPYTNETVNVEKYNRTYRQAKAIFDQNPTTAQGMVARIQIVGIDTPATPEGLLYAIEDIQEEHNDWQVFMTDMEEIEYIQACSAWADSTELSEAQINSGIEEYPKQYFARYFLDESTKADFFDDLESGNIVFNSSRGSVHVVTNEDEELAAAIYADIAAHYPIHTTAKFKVLEGITPADLKKTERDILEAYNLNYYKKEYKRVLFREGVCTNGQYIDINISRDYIVKSIRERLYDLLQRYSVVPYTNGGFSLAGDAVAGGIRDAFDNGMVAPNEDNQPHFEMQVPRREDATRDESLNRVMPKIRFVAMATGAIHQVAVSGVLSADMSRNLQTYISLGYL